jgi:hypothetical protein
MRTRVATRSLGGGVGLGCGLALAVACGVPMGGSVMSGVGVETTAPDGAGVVPDLGPAAVGTGTV